MRIEIESDVVGGRMGGKRERRGERKKSAVRPAVSTPDGFRHAARPHQMTAAAAAAERLHFCIFVVVAVVL